MKMINSCFTTLYQELSPQKDIRYNVELKVQIYEYSLVSHYKYGVNIILSPCQSTLKQTENCSSRYRKIFCPGENPVSWVFNLKVKPSLVTTRHNAQVELDSRVQLVPNLYRESHIQSLTVTGHPPN